MWSENLKGLGMGCVAGCNIRSKTCYRQLSAPILALWGVHGFEARALPRIGNHGRFTKDWAPPTPTHPPHPPTHTSTHTTHTITVCGLLWIPVVDTPGPCFSALHLCNPRWIQGALLSNPMALARLHLCVCAEIVSTIQCNLGHKSVH